MKNQNLPVQPGSLLESMKPDGAKKFGEAILKSIQDLGLGVLSKSDFEALMFHHIALNIDKTKVRDNYDWMRLLKLTPPKLRSIQLIRTAKLRNLDLGSVDNLNEIVSALGQTNAEIEDRENGLIRFYIPDVHVQMLIEKIVVGHKSSIDYKLNSNILILRYESFLKILDMLIKNRNEKDNLLDELNKDKSAVKLDKKLTGIDTVWLDLKNKFKDETLNELAKESIGWALKAFKKKIGL